MQISNSQLATLEALASQHGCPRREVPPGTVLQTRSASQEILLICSGSCRVLDPARHFGSLTVMRVEAPYICGALAL